MLTAGAIKRNEFLSIEVKKTFVMEARTHGKVTAAKLNVTWTNEPSCEAFTSCEMYFGS